jgi:phosphoglycolate phosphatase-like HAD superfamily hydrolase
MGGAPAVVLFDIDGTLIRRAGPHHRDALVGAIHEEARLETTMDGIPTQGMLDRDIIRMMMLRAGADEASIASCMPAVTARAQAIYLRNRPDLKRKTCPGVRLALRRLYRAGVPLGLVTGNLTAIGWRKMEAAGLMRYFRFGAFAEQASTRAGLVAIALKRARTSGWLRRDTPVTLVGDHLNDVLAAKLNGIRSIAVATGVLKRADLACCSPDLLLPDLRSLRLEMVL